MHPAVVFQAMVSSALAAGLAVYVGSQRPLTYERGALLGVLLTIATWGLGLILAWSAPPEGPTARALVLLHYGGVYGLPPFWLFLAARCTQARPVEEQPGSSLAGLLTPSLLLYLLVATNRHHHLFAPSLDIRVLTLNPAFWAGPAFWVGVAWCYGCVVAGIALAARGAWTAASPVERRRLGLLTLAAAVPLVCNALYLTNALPLGFSTTPAALGFTGLLLVVVIARYRFLEPRPVPARELIARLGDGLVLADGEGSVIEMNPAAERLLGRRLSELRGQPLLTALEAIWPEELPPLGLLAGVQEPVLRTLHLPGDRVLEVSLGQLGPGLGTLAVIRDRSEAHRHERLWHRRQRLESLGVLAAGIAHEINNPLAFLRSNLAQLEQLVSTLEMRLGPEAREAKAEAAEMRELVGEALAGADRIGAIVASTRRLSREPPEEREPVDLNAVAREAARLASFHANHAAALELDLEEPAPWAQGSAAQLSQVLLNLLLNAKQAVGSNPDARVRLETHRRGREVEIAVHDNGPGIPPEVESHLFEPFFTTKPPDEGTGLGLAIAYDLVRQHAGTLTVKRSPLGGACFRVVLPALG